MQVAGLTNTTSSISWLLPDPHTRSTLPARLVGGVVDALGLVLDHYCGGISRRCLEEEENAKVAAENVRLFDDAARVKPTVR